MENTPLECVSFITFLGVTVDNNLSWKYHIDNICKITSRNIGIIYKVKTCLPLNSLSMLYSSLILPYLNYGLLVWGNTHQTLLDKVLLLQKKVIRIICNSPFRCHTDGLFFENNILKVKDLYLFQLGQLCILIIIIICCHLFFKKCLLKLAQSIITQQDILQNFIYLSCNEVKNAPSINILKTKIEIVFITIL